jgi:hypothetical protein
LTKTPILVTNACSFLELLARKGFRSGSFPPGGRTLLPDRTCGLAGVGERPDVSGSKDFCPRKLARKI